MKELEDMIARLQIPVVEVIYLPARPECEGCGRELENDSYRGCCSFNCYCLWSCID
jgi:hypothetical protein